MQLCKKFILAACFLISNAVAAPSINPMENSKPFPITPEVKRYIVSTAKQYHFKQSELENYFAHARILPSVIDRMNAPFEAKPWDFYRTYFVTPERIRLGAQYWREHEADLNRVAAYYHVSPQIIIAILGVETMYGTGTGHYPVLDTLATLAFYYPAREKFFRQELTNYFLLTRHENLPVLALRGSYAGALGIPQFMPSSYRNYGVTLQKNKRIDLFKDHETAIASIGHYLRLSGFNNAEPVAVPVVLSSKFSAQKIISPKAVPLETVSQLSNLGVNFKQKFQGKDKAALIALRKAQGNEYWAVFRNFKAIMSYNPNINYAMAVYQLSEELKKAHEQDKLKHSA